MRRLFFIFVTVIGVLQIPMQSINAQNMKKEEVPQNLSAFPVGKENAGFEQYFTGKSWLAPLTGNKDLNVPMFNVTFEPGCRNNWHSHTGGQILIAVGGVGYYQERGKAARRLLPGDVVEIAPDVEHWHGAAPDSWFRIWLLNAIRRPTRILGWNGWTMNSMLKLRKMTEEAD